jgi:sulfoxide reductase heme-binding subunit YedZ
MDLNIPANIRDRLVRHYLILIILVISASCIFYFNKGQRDTITFIAWSSGIISFVLLAASLIFGPLNLLFKRINRVSTYIRRDLGITAGFLALLHSVTGLFVHLRGKAWMYFLNKSETGFSIRLDDFGMANWTGLVAAILVLVLLLTSNDAMLRMMTPGIWKNIQRLSYLMFLLVVVHIYFYYEGNKNKDLIHFFYIPVILIVMAMQGAGMLIRKKSG